MQLPSWLNYRFWIFLLLGKVAFSQQWVPLGGGANDQVRDIWIDTLTDEIYASGNFTSIGGIPSGGVAKWNGTSWIDICPECSNQQIFRVLQYQQKMYLSGYFNLNNEYIYLAENDGSGWQQSCEMDNAGIIYDFEDTLYMRGLFTEIDGVPQDDFSKFDGNQWQQAFQTSPSDWEFENFVVYDLARYNGDLIVAGQFINEGQGIYNFATYKNGVFSPFEPTILAELYEKMIVYKGILYIAGQQKQSQGAPSDYLMAWNGEEYFNPFPEVEFIYSIRDLQIIDDELYILSIFNYENDSTIYYAGKFDGENFCSFGGSYDNITVTEYSPPSKIRGLNGEIYITARGMIHDDISWIGKWIGTEMDTCIYSPITVSLTEKSIESSLKLYPNPASDQIKLTFENSGFEHEEIILFDKVGKEVLRQKINPKVGLNEISIDLGTLKSGVYFVSLKNSGKYGTAKLVKL